MQFQLQDALNVYLFPFLIAIPIAVVLFLLVTRRDDAPSDKQEGPDRGPATGRRATPEAGSSSRSPASAVAPASTSQTARSAAAVPIAAQRPPAPSAFEPEADPGSAIPQGRAGLLVVDDSAVARAKLRKLFESAGYTVTVARDGIEALELLGKASFALMITDLEMPNMDGIDLIAAVSGSLETEDMPILAITGHDDLQAKVHEYQSLFGIFRKPWNDRELLRRVETLVRVQAAVLAGVSRH